MSKGMDLLKKANETREEGNALKSLQIADEATIELQKEGNLPKVAEAQAVRFLGYNHLAQKTGDNAFLLLAKNAANSAVEIAESCGDKTALAIPYFNLAKAFYALKDWGKSAEIYKKAVDSLVANPPESHNRQGVVADFEIHLAEAEYRNGDKSALERLIQAVDKLDKSDEKTVSAYNYHVWKSGAYMAAADMLRDDDPGMAKQYLEMAKDVIDSDPALAIRKTQWQKLADSFRK